MGFFGGAVGRIMDISARSSPIAVLLQIITMRRDGKWEGMFRFRGWRMFRKTSQDGNAGTTDRRKGLVVVGLRSV